VTAGSLLLFVVVLICLYTDLTARKIYNPVVVAGMLGAVVLNIIRLGFFEGVLFASAGLLAGLALLIVPFICGVLGAGDVKMLGMIGAFTGPELAVQVLLASALAGGSYALVVLLIGKRPLWRLKKTLTGLFFFAVTRSPLYLKTLEDKKSTADAIPYGAALAAGVLTVYFLGLRLPGF